MKHQHTPSSVSRRFKRARFAPALLVVLLAAPQAWSQSLKLPGTSAGALPAAGMPAAPSARQAPAPSSKPSAPRSTQVVPVDAIVAVVNNEVITAQELEARMQLVEARLKSQGVSLPPRAQFQQQLLERMIVDRAQMQEAKDQGIRVDDNLLDMAIARIAQQNGMSVQDFRNKVERDGTPFDRFREEIRGEIMTQRLREKEVVNKVQVTESEVDNFLAANGGAMAAQPELDLAQILIRIPENATPEQIAQRRARADEALQQLRTGGDFARVAATYSDASDALTGGDMG
jgi:peptidyl-prolyl cis-trans isomerase SurA